MTENQLYNQIRQYASRLGDTNYQEVACVTTLYQIAEKLRVQPSSILQWHTQGHLRCFDMNVPSYYSRNIYFMITHNRDLVLEGQHTCLSNMCDVFVSKFSESEYTAEVEMIKASHINPAYYDSSSVPTPIEPDLVFQISKSC